MSIDYGFQYSAQLFSAQYSAQLFSALGFLPINYDPICGNNPTHPLFFFTCPTHIFNFQTIADAIKPNTKIVWVESPTNPTLKITDIRSVADVVRSIRADM